MTASHESLPAATRRRRIVLGAAAAVVVAIMMVVVIAGASSDSDGSMRDAFAAALPSDPTIDTVAFSAPIVTDTAAPTTLDTAVAVTEAPTTTTVPDTAAPVTAAEVVQPTVTTAAPTVIPAAGSNCSYAGSISIPATGVTAWILAEQQAFADGLLCGNHKADHIEQGVDILPGFASFEDSLAGGTRLQGKVPAIIFGHRNSHNRPLHDIDDLVAGDDVVITNADGTTIHMTVVGLELLPVKQATVELLSASTDGTAEVRLVACSHKDGTPGGIDYRWVATLVRA